MIDGLNSKDKIKEDWFEHFKRIDKKRQNSDFARGAERIYFWLFNQFGIPNSSPIGADLFFETYNAFIHIDIKTEKLNNPSDYKGKVPVGENQTSYYSKNKYKINRKELKLQIVKPHHKGKNPGDFLERSEEEIIQLLKSTFTD